MHFVSTPYSIRVTLCESLIVIIFSDALNGNPNLKYVRSNVPLGVQHEGSSKIMYISPPLVSPGFRTSRHTHHNRLLSLSHPLNRVNINDRSF